MKWVATVAALMMYLSSFAVMAISFTLSMPSCASVTFGKRADGTIVVRCNGKTEPVLLLSPGACEHPIVDRSDPQKPKLTCS